jgi:hypothetical protein
MQTNQNERINEYDATNVTRIVMKKVEINPDKLY